MTFSEQYQDLIILQYKDKPNAVAEIKLRLKHFSEVNDVIKSLLYEYDVDTAVGHQLDVIGRIVGITRNVPKGTAVEYFGFQNHMHAQGFGLAPFFTHNSPQYTASQLTDDDFRYVVKAKIAKNNVAAQMANTDRLNLQQAFQFIFKGMAYCVEVNNLQPNDLQTTSPNMRLDVYVDDSFDADMLRTLVSLDLLPRPQTVGIGVIYLTSGIAFGFQNFTNSAGFGLAPFTRILTI